MSIINKYLNLEMLAQFLDNLKHLFATKDEFKNIKSVISIEQTTTSTEDNGINIITVTFSDGSTSQFNIKNGSEGTPGTTPSLDLEIRDGHLWVTY